MALIDWSDELSVGIESIDAQHRNLVEIVNTFEEARRRGRGSRIMNQILNDIIGYTQEHFAFEEKLLIEAEYPGLKLHQAQHRQLLQKIERFQHEYQHENRRITTEVGDFLNYWLTSHILKHDMEYSACLKGEPVEA